MKQLGLGIAIADKGAGPNEATLRQVEFERRWPKYAPEGAVIERGEEESDLEMARRRA